MIGAIVREDSPDPAEPGRPGPPVDAATLFDFGPYRLDVRSRRLRRGHEVLQISPRAFEILALLVQRAGRTVSKAELMQHVWPDVFVDEANLAQHVSQLRRRLGDSPKLPEYITTIPRQGYQFVAEVQPVRDPGGSIPAPPAEPARSRLVMAAAVLVLVTAVIAVGFGWPARREGTGSNDTEAHRARERGRFLLAQNTPDSSALAVQALEDAVRLDPQSVGAHADLALAHVSLFLARRTPRRQALARAQAAANRAFELDATSSEAHTAHGAVSLQLLGNARLAQDALRRATTLDPSNVMALDLLARALRHDGLFDESVAAARRGLALDPTSVRAHMNLAQSMHFSGRNLDEALNICREAIQLDRGSGPLLDLAADLADLQGRLDDAVNFRAGAERAWNRPELAELLEAAYHTRGYTAAMTSYIEARIDALDRRNPGDPASGFERGRLLTRLGRLDEAFAAFDAAVVGDFSVGVYALRHHPAYRAIRADPRFPDLLARTTPR